MSKFEFSFMNNVEIFLMNFVKNTLKIDNSIFENKKEENSFIKYNMRGSLIFILFLKSNEILQVKLVENSHQIQTKVVDF
jgi:hypothetical protein